MKIPGTVPLVESTEIILSPTPSSDPDDPLNWSPRRKLLSMFCMVLYCVAICVPSASIFSVFIPISQNTGLPLATLNQGTGYMFLLFGLGCIIVHPLSVKYGKRPVYLISVLGTALIQLWGPKINSSGTWIGSKVIQGLLGASVESLCEVTVSDLWFEHERGRWIGVYGFALMFASNIAPVFAGFITQSMGWRWVLYWGSIFDAVCFLFLFLFFEETNFRRQGEQSLQADSELENETEAGEKKKQVQFITDVEVGQLFEKKSFLSKLSPFSVSKETILLPMLVRPFTLVKYPVVLFSGFMCGTGLICFNICNATTSFVLSNAPYNFPASRVGLCYLSPCVMVLVFSFYGGYISDKLRVLLARRNGGLSEPEHRLWILSAYLLLCPPALVLWGVGASNGIHWFPIVFGMGLVKGLGTLTSISAINYVVDSYRDMTSDSMVLVMLIRNTMSFCISYGITPWFMNEGLTRCFAEAAGLAFACCATMFIFVRWGKKMREVGAERYWRMVEEK
ncbi:major facilitator superfamily domain-containing protein [Yarrowia lipolytica]|jgi:MFS family permease|nr:major facilitator superfamily domain-containing protein [Yarrowia lipolytica]KAE8169634.1 major facilitator superfamily domain-containing protein [Yarrowia lipolytica]KAJ8051760.1 major facilitator superfamily domain-containing protein [Yarrowia lipolytica]QNP95429.1 Putative MFS-type transporter [Yarrowia lipolytica]RMI95574.1 major facilitator superfamily domain-containing protein [Yarrowia lipolytica]